MKKTVDYKTKGTCSRGIHVEVEDGIVTDVKFDGGCSGNTKGVASLVVGMSAEEAIKRLSGIKCGLKPTSCPDQLSIAIKEAISK